MINIYKCFLTIDNGTYVKDTTEIVVSKRKLKRQEILEQLKQKSPYADYDTFIKNFIIIPVTIIKVIQIL